MWNLTADKARRASIIIGSHGRECAHKAIKSFSWYTGINLFSPTFLTFDITDRCQLRCLTCTKWQTPPEVQYEELNNKEWRTIILKLKRWLGEFSFIFSGGEPFLRKDILRLISFAVENGIHPYVISNGCGFSSAAEKIVTSGLESLTVSLNGMSPSTHDFTRGVIGAHHKTLKFIREVNAQRKKLKSQMTLSIQTILMPFNCDEAVDLVEWAKHEEIDNIRFQPLDRLGPIKPFHAINPVTAKDVNNEWYRRTLNDAAENEKLDRVIDELIEYKQQGYPIATSMEQLRLIKTYYRNRKELGHLRCGIGVSRFNIDPYGYVRLCFEMKPIGNVQFATPEELYNSKRAIEQRQLIRKCNSTCHWLLST